MFPTKVILAHCLPSGDVRHFLLQFAFCILKGANLGRFCFPGIRHIGIPYTLYQLSAKLGSHVFALSGFHGVVQYCYVLFSIPSLRQLTLVIS